MDLVPKKVDDNSEWVVIIGSAGAVGSFAVQVCFLFTNISGFDLMNCPDCPYLRIQSSGSLLSERY